MRSGVGQTGPSADPVELVAGSGRSSPPLPSTDELYSIAYDELKRLASVVRRGDPYTTITTTALVHDAWFKLAGTLGGRYASEAHFKHIVVRAMRQVLVDSARRRRAVKRAGIHITLDDALAATLGVEERLLGIDEALTRLALLSERQARVVEARYFGGLDVCETARLLNVSEATVQRDWRLARAWLAVELRNPS
jgi:RNA polymerase sigma-70 factor, ECF subfamily